MARQNSESPARSTRKVLFHRLTSGRCYGCTILHCRHKPSCSVNIDSSIILPLRCLLVGHICLQALKPDGTVACVFGNECRQELSACAQRLSRREDELSIPKIEYSRAHDNAVLRTSVSPDVFRATNINGPFVRQRTFQLSSHSVGRKPLQVPGRTSADKRSF